MANTKWTQWYPLSFVCLFVCFRRFWQGTSPPPYLTIPLCIYYDFQFSVLAGFLCMCPGTYIYVSVSTFVLHTFSFFFFSFCLVCPIPLCFCFILFYYYSLDVYLVSSERQIGLDSDRRRGGGALRKAGARAGEGNHGQNINVWEKNLWSIKENNTFLKLKEKKKVDLDKL